ncbi:hypothetical protein VTN02DRAFT_3315 [Thermoascus thermophilus]
MDTPSLPHATLISSEWTALRDCLQSGRPVSVDGQSLTIPEVIAVCLYGAQPSLTTDPATIDRVQRSVDVLDQQLQQGRTIYGVNTGFGGSADTRTDSVERLQIALQQHLHVGILLPSDKGLAAGGALASSRTATGHLRQHALPVAVVRAMMLIRCNSLLRGHSGVRIAVVQAILTLLAREMTPVVPLRGSISASGDLSPLSYIAGVLEGNPDVFVRVATDDDDNPIYLPADKALEQAGLSPVRLQAKEGLGISNGTATSCAAACIAIHQAQQMALLVQLLTAMGTEALLGTAQNYHPFLSATRPHPGQAEAAANIRAFLAGSQLSPDQGPRTRGLAQDRYALRTAPQWIGPPLEDLLLAHRQVAVEVNATTDNPLIDVADQRIHHGGNFQAASLSSAMEKTQTALQALGRLMYAQCSELINHTLNKGLPPNLSADDPSLSFTCKGFDVNMAAYMAELAYLAHPVGPHAQVAEMLNQSVNSLALVAARYALEAVEVVSLMAATYLYALCQALDLRCLHAEFATAAERAIREVVHDVWRPLFRAGAGDDGRSRDLDALASRAWDTLLEKWTALSHRDLDDRGREAARESVGPLLELLISRSESPSDGISLIHDYQTRAASTLSAVYDRTRAAFFAHQTTPDYLSPASRTIYEFVRRELDVPMHRGLVDHPTFQPADDTRGSRAGEERTQQKQNRKILGTLASEIYLSVRDGRLHGRVVEAWRRAHRGDHLSTEASS